jgi:hypothetical protein
MKPQTRERILEALEEKIGRHELDQFMKTCPSDEAIRDRLIAEKNRIASAPANKSPEPLRRITTGMLRG